MHFWPAFVLSVLNLSGDTVFVSLISEAKSSELNESRLAACLRALSQSY